MIYLKAGVEAITMGVFERDIGMPFLLGTKAGRKTFEYCIQNRTISGRSPTANSDPDGIADLVKDYEQKRNVNARTGLSSPGSYVVGLIYVVHTVPLASLTLQIARRPTGPGSCPCFPGDYHRCRVSGKLV